MITTKFIEQLLVYVLDQKPKLQNMADIMAVVIKFVDQHPTTADMPLKEITQDCLLPAIESFIHHGLISWYVFESSKSFFENRKMTLDYIDSLVKLMNLKPHKQKRKWCCCC